MGLYDVDQMILARHQGMWYEGKVVDVEPAAGATGEARYKIHFQGWNSRWDYWEKQSSGDLMADTEENRAKNMGKGKGKTNATAGKDGAKDAGKDAGKKRPSKDDGKKGGNKKAKTGSKKGGDATDTPTPDAPTPDAPPELARLRFNLSTSLKRELIAGWEKITREDKLVHLPRSVTVSTILERFESDSRAKARSPEQAEMAGEITSGLRAYFDRSLRAVLLYTQEHAQADELLTGGKAPCDVYGGEHLLRLFVKLPELVPLGDMDQDATHLLHMRLQDFLRWLQRNAASSFGCGYVSVKDGKTVLEPERTKEYVAPQEKEKKGASPETSKRSAEPEPVAA
jgi:mortality factor 4-like protein 1